MNSHGGKFGCEMGRSGNVTQGNFCDTELAERTQRHRFGYQRFPSVESSRRRMSYQDLMRDGLYARSQVPQECAVQCRRRQTHVLIAQRIGFAATAANVA